MHHDTPLISTIVAGLVLAYIFGMIAHRFRMPPLVGYLLAGVLVGPYTPGFIADQAIGAELAEIGVILLMFGVGLHFSLKDLMSVRSLAIPGAIAQIALATLLGLGLALLLGWGVGAGIIFGLALSVASTVVLLKALQDRRLVETERGRIAVGWLIVEDLAMVLALVLIPAFASLGGETTIHDPFVSFVERLLGNSVGIWGVLALTILKLAAFVGFMLVVGRRAIPWALHITAHTGSRELFRLAVLAIALGVAMGSAVLFGVSLALGAFFAGMILSESELSHRAAQETLPLRDAFAVLFFVSVGMLFDPTIILSDPLPVLATVFIIIIGKSAAAFGIVLLFKRPVATALTISASLAQIGEFSFILASLGVSLAILPQQGQDLILAGALISIFLNPVVFWAVDRVKPRFEAKVAQRQAARMERDGVRIEPHPTLAASNGPLTTDAPGEPGVDRGAQGADDDVPEPTSQSGHTILVGYGRVGRVVGEGLQSVGSPLVVIEDSDHSVAAARAAGIEVVVGNAASTEVLRLANLAGARCLMIAIPNGFEAGSICEASRKLSPGVRIIARAHSIEEEAHLRSFGANDVIMGEREIGLGMLAWLRGERGQNNPPPADAPEVAERLNSTAPMARTVEPATIAAVSNTENFVPAVEHAPVDAGLMAEEDATLPAQQAPADAEDVLAADLAGLESFEPDNFDVEQPTSDPDSVPAEPIRGADDSGIAEDEATPPEAVSAIEIDATAVEAEVVEAETLPPEDIEPVEEAPISEEPSAPAQVLVATQEVDVAVMPQTAPSQVIVDQRAIMAAHIILPPGMDDQSPDQLDAEAPSNEQVLLQAEDDDAIRLSPEHQDGEVAPAPEESQGVVPPVIPEPKS